MYAYFKFSEKFNCTSNDMLKANMQNYHHNTFGYFYVIVLRMESCCFDKPHVLFIYRYLLEITNIKRNIIVSITSVLIIPLKKNTKKKTQKTQINTPATKTIKETTPINHICRCTRK